MLNRGTTSNYGKGKVTLLKVKSSECWKMRSMKLESQLHQGYYIMGIYSLGAGFYLYFSQNCLFSGLSSGLCAVSPSSTDISMNLES